MPQCDPLDGAQEWAQWIEVQQSAGSLLGVASVLVRPGFSSTALRRPWRTWLTEGLALVVVIGGLAAMGVVSVPLFITLLIGWSRFSDQQRY